MSAVNFNPTLNMCRVSWGQIIMAYLLNPTLHIKTHQVIRKVSTEMHWRLVIDESSVKSMTFSKHILRNEEWTITTL